MVMLLDTSAYRLNVPIPEIAAQLGRRLVRCRALSVQPAADAGHARSGSRTRRHTAISPSQTLPAPAATPTAAVSQMRGGRGEALDVFLLRPLQDGPGADEADAGRDALDGARQVAGVGVALNRDEDERRAAQRHRHVRAQTRRTLPTHSRSAPISPPSTAAAPSRKMTRAKVGRVGQAQQFIHEYHRGVIRPLAILAVIMSTQAAVEWRPSFTLVQPELFAATGGNTNAWADVDNDGDLDYFVGFRGRAEPLLSKRSRHVPRTSPPRSGSCDVGRKRAPWRGATSTPTATPISTSASPIRSVPSKVYRNDGNGKRFVDVADRDWPRPDGRQPSAGVD